MKSKIIREMAEKLGLPVIDIKLSKVDPKDFIGEDLSIRGALNEAIDKVVEENITKQLANPFREVNVGDMVLAEIQQGVIITAAVDAIEDGIVYLLGDDGEPFCAPLENCTKGFV